MVRRGRMALFRALFAGLEEDALRNAGVILSDLRSALFLGRNGRMRISCLIFARRLPRRSAWDELRGTAEFASVVLVECSLRGHQGPPFHSTAFYTCVVRVG